MGKEIAPWPGQEAPPARRHGVAGVLESPRKAIHARQRGMAWATEAPALRSLGPFPPPSPGDSGKETQEKQGSHLKMRESRLD